MDGDAKKSVLVTLSDARYLEQAKQLFSSVYWNAGWRGDYLLLAHEVPEEKLRWFRDKGILVRPVRALDEGTIGLQGHPATVASKLHVFGPYFKRWRNVVFLDADIIVRASLETLGAVRGFAAPLATGIVFKDEFYAADPALWKRLKSEYPLRGKAFNSGVFAFSTDIIEPDTFDTLLSLYRRYGILNKCGEEGTLNLFFRGRWQMLSMAYNMYPDYVHHTFFIAYADIRAVIVHFVASAKPWTRESPWHGEWLENLKRADRIDLLSPQPPLKAWTEGEMRSYMRHLFLTRWVYAGYRNYVRIAWSAFDRAIGRAGMLIRAVSPRAYLALKPLAPKMPRPR